MIIYKVTFAFINFTSNISDQVSISFTANRTLTYGTVDLTDSHAHKCKREHARGIFACLRSAYTERQ